MDILNKNKYILFIKGITKADLDESLPNNLDYVVETNNDVLKIDILKSIRDHTIPQEFVDMNTWPKSTNLRCSQCNLNFDCMPFPNITSIYIDKGAVKYRIQQRYFCNASCANEYNYTNNDLHLARINEQRILNVHNTHFASYHKGYLPTIPRLNIRITDLDIYIGKGGISVPQYQDTINKYYKVNYKA